KKRRIIGKPGDADAQEAAPAPAVVSPVPAPVPSTAPKPVTSARPVETQLTRQELQAKLLREAEESRMIALEEARRREERARADASEEEKKRAEENRKTEEAAAEALAEQMRQDAAAPAKGDDALVQAKPPAPDDEEDEHEGRRHTTGHHAPARKPDAARPARGRGDQDRRQAGKLTVHRALDDEDGARARSLAALKRAREKERRAHMQSGQAAKQYRDVTVPETITVSELANRMAERTGDVIKALFKLGMPAKSGDTIDQDTAELIVNEFGHNIVRVSDADVDIAHAEDVDAPESLKSRPPVVTIMGHVDHGKTSLLDALRGTDVVRGEAGGITQHIGAYQITTKGDQKITFLDTPGHAAFTAMRQRGANVTDIVVLVVAADDGPKPQTVEAINHARAANVPMIVAITKADKHEADAQKVREQLLQYEVIVESLSGDVQEVEVSAHTKAGLDELIEKILLQAELSELSANPDRPAEGIVIESKLDKGRGAVATILVQRGSLKTGDIFVVGSESGRVRALVDDKGRQLKEAGPSLPVEVLGLGGVPKSGDVLSVVESEARAREVAAYRAEVATRKRTTVAPTSLENMFSALRESQAQEYPLVVKGDVHGSVEAIVAALEALSNDDIKVRVLHSGVGGITESDVTLAGASGAPIIGFNVRANAKARDIAERQKVALKYYDIIYDLIDEIKAGMAGQLGPERFETVVGRAEIREVFPAGKHGKAAGLLVTEGYIRKALKARVTRDDVIIYNGSIASLRRFKDDVEEVRSGLECGVTLEATTDVKKGDFLETFEVEERERVL
ncbi:MAG: translation initiation factor IF-2, partial [Alphaproteobacteria bacterium]|nr:translation initiation factor IF-2 [Alphaproteobacteria bacterium]